MSDIECVFSQSKLRRNRAPTARPKSKRERGCCENAKVTQTHTRTPNAKDAIPSRCFALSAFESAHTYNRLCGECNIEDVERMIQLSKEKKVKKNLSLCRKSCVCKSNEKFVLEMLRLRCGVVCALYDVQYIHQAAPGAVCNWQLLLSFNRLHSPSLVRAAKTLNKADSRPQHSLAHCCYRLLDTNKQRQRHLRLTATHAIKCE